MLGTVTANAKKRTALPFPSQPTTGTTPITPVGTTGPTTVQDALQNTTNTVDQAKAALNATQPYIDQYLKPNAAGVTPFRQSLTNTKATSTANAYDAAVSNTRNKAAAAGFGTSSQPITFGAEAGLANERARAIADIPSQVNLEAQPIETQAAQMQAQQGSVLNALANTQQAQTGTLSAADLERERIAAQQKMASDQQKAALAGGLVQTGIGIAAPAIKSALTKTPTPATFGPQPGSPEFVGPVNQPPTNQVSDLPGSIGTVAGLGTAGISAALAGTAAPAAAIPAVSVSIPELGILGGSAATGAGAAGAAGAGVAGADATAAGATAASGGSFGTTLAALATNPVTWAVAGAITAAIIWRKSQVHPTATTFVDHYQKPFGDHLASVVNGFDQAFATGQMTREQAQAAYDETVRLINDFKQDTNAFAQKGSHENTVAHQAAQTMAANFGPNWEKILGKMQQEIAGLT